MNDAIEQTPSSYKNATIIVSVVFFVLLIGAYFLIKNAGGKSLTDEEKNQLLEKFNSSTLDNKKLTESEKNFILNNYLTRQKISDKVSGKTDFTESDKALLIEKSTK